MKFHFLSSVSSTFFHLSNVSLYFRNQFPSLNIRTEPPSIPAWQLQSSIGENSPPHSDHEKEGKEQDDDLLRVRGERSESGGSNSSEEVVTKSDSSLEIM